MTHGTPLPLAGLRILTLAHLYPGPFATMLLADLGADVVIVEGPRTPDRTRRFPGHFEALNRNKRAVSIDLKDPAGREAFLRLVETADAVFEGFRPGVMDRLGLGADTLRARHPGVVCVSISGYGQTGPMSSHGAHDLSLQGSAGLIDIPSGEEAEHSLAGLMLGDIAAAQAAALGVVVALLQRERTGHSPVVDVAMLDSLVCWTTPSLVPAMNGLAPARLPPNDPGYGVFATADGVQMTISISGEDHLWRALCDTVGLPQHAPLTEEERIRTRTPVQADLRSALRQHAAPWLLPKLDASGIPWGLVRRPDEVPLDPQVQARRIVVELQTDDGQTLQYVRQPLVFDGQFTGIRCRAPKLGEHNDELLSPSPATHV
jgi:crotonobetainyl-CoA:carnitine CoA-transferase CaiB-like acyl-CoA transferase